MFDEKIGSIFSISKSISKDPRWWKGEPVRFCFMILLLRDIFE